MSLRSPRGIYERKVKTPFGTFFLYASVSGLYALSFPGGAGRHVNMPGKEKEPVFLQQAVRELEEYLAGGRNTFSRFMLDLEDYSPFQKKVLSLLSRVPFGHTVSYSELASRAGSPSGARAVGGVMSSNRLPVFIPCHRVLGAGGLIGGYSGGLNWKRRLLALERIEFRAPAKEKVG